MDVKTAARLYELRRKNRMSQEELADALGVTRQAVLKWERAESSPDTDNLIALARLYGVSLDELVGLSDIESEPQISEEQQTEGQKAKEENTKEEKAKSGINFEIKDGSSKVGIKLNDIDIEDGKSRIKIDGSGIYIVDGEDKVKINKSGVYVGDKHIVKKNIFSSIIVFVVVIAYLLMGSLADLWHPAWLLFFLIPLAGGLETAIRKRNALAFPFPLICVVIFLSLGFLWDLWHPTWVVFVTIPLYYAVVNTIKDREKSNF